MKLHSKIFILSLVFIAFASCSKNIMLDKLKQIQKIGDYDPSLALRMLDSLEVSESFETEYLRYKYELLKIRLNDKAENVATSDVAIKKIVVYFQLHGNLLEKQESFYYAGSVYRDLQDTPRSMEYFFKSIDYATETQYCDSIMLCNTYSNLNDLFYRVQNYKEAISMAKKELDISRRLKKDVVLPFMHLGTAYLASKEKRLAHSSFDKAFNYINHSKEYPSNQEYLVYLLCHYSELGDSAKAKECFDLIIKKPLRQYTPFTCLSFAQYYKLQNKSDSAIIYCKHILDDGTSIYNMYDASKLLYDIYKSQGDISNADKIASIYMQLSDSLDFGKRQELSATVNNEYKYHLDKKQEEKLQDEKETYKKALIKLILIIVILVIIAYVIYIRKKNNHLQKILALSFELKHISIEEKKMQNEIKYKEIELNKSKITIQNYSHELETTKKKIQCLNEEISNYEETLKEKEQQLSEKINQNKTFIRLLHQSDLECKSEDVINAIRQSSSGKKNMQNSDWKQLYKAVDELYPSFNDRLLKELKTLTDQQMQVCYLMKIGLSNKQIQNMTNLSRVTVWRWVKKYDWVLTSDDSVKK